MLLFGLFEVADWLLILLTLLVAKSLYSAWQPSYWKRRGVPGPTSYPLVGNMPYYMKGGGKPETYGLKTFGKVYGVSASGMNFLEVADEEMLREILVKNFSKFQNRPSLDFMNDDISKSAVTTLKDDDWRRVRNILTPSFTTGKLKMMMGSVQDCIAVTDKIVGALTDDNEAFEAKELFGAYTMDVIAQTAFGIKVDAQTDKDCEFVRISRQAFGLKLNHPKFLFLFIFPWALPLWKRIFDYKMIKQECASFFTKIVDQIMCNRKEDSKNRKDFMQLMMDVHKEEVDIDSVAKEVQELGGEYDHTQSSGHKGLTKTEIIAQGLTFFIAGFDTTAGTLAFLVYNLACNPECQEKLYEEIVQEHGEKEEPDYHSLNKSQYLTMCIDETLRMFPIALKLAREVSTDTVLCGIPLSKGNIIEVPVHAIHHDPEIYPEPELFRPERFSAEAKADRSPFHYLPFGYGPRNCIGMRLAQMEIKAVMISLVRKYRFITCEKTERPLTFKQDVLLKAANGIWLKVERRSQGD